ncbi:COQ9-domain-containing protein [Podospora appendiculata]|uniref:Ubiquinone biosynthesis protein n=1 Tax=Podospora appendiculata TaxID=314037 RepID=A0AAE0XCM7_9PEZI|nr:COQ9-domain-containing protein [Podospora appendiculata]
MRPQALSRTAASAAAGASWLLTPRAAWTRTPAATPSTSSSITSTSTTTRRAQPNLIQPTSRAYHAYTHPAPPPPFSPIETAILSAAYTHVPTHGFSRTSLALGARSAGYLDISTNLLPDGVFSLIKYHLLSQRELLSTTPLPPSPPLSSRVELLTFTRLLANAPVLPHLQSALAIMAQPSYIPTSLAELAVLADEILYLAGDVAVDPTWYTKRASLSAIYAASELFMTNDSSTGFRDTRAFLGRRLGEAEELGGAVRSVGEWVGFNAKAGVNVLRSWGAPI